MTGNKDSGTTPAKIEATKVGAYAVFSLPGSITYQNCAGIETGLLELIEKKQSAVILECKEVSFLDSVALEMLLRVQEVYQGRGGRMKIVGLNAVCLDTLIATRLINQFHVYPDMQEAVKEAS